MTHYRDLTAGLTQLLGGATRELDREQLRYVLNEIQRLSAQACLLIDQEIIRELKDAKRAMQEHGFTREVEPPSLKRTYTLDDLL